jgi:hypothetical protein
MTRQKKQSTEAAVRDIRRRTLRKFSPEAKIRIVLEGLHRAARDSVVQPACSGSAGAVVDSDGEDSCRNSPCDRAPSRSRERISASGGGTSRASARRWRCSCCSTAGRTRDSCVPPSRAPWGSGAPIQLPAPRSIDVNPGSELGVARSNRARVTICLCALTRFAPASVAYQSTEPDRTIRAARIHSAMRVNGFWGWRG